MPPERRSAECEYCAICMVEDLISGSVFEEMIGWQLDETLMLDV